MYHRAVNDKTNDFNGKLMQMLVKKNPKKNTFKCVY